MTRRTLNQKTFFDPEFVRPGCLQEGTLPWLLARQRGLLFPGHLFRGWRGESRMGRPAWPATVLATLCLLRWSEEGLSRRGACRHAHTDSAWRAALGLQMDMPTPNEKTLREFERFLRRRDPNTKLRGYERLHNHFAKLCVDEGVVEPKKAVWSFDSTPMYCYGAVVDTVRLLGDGLRALGAEWARATKETLNDLAARWKLPLLTTKSTKGAFRIQWASASARSKVVSELADAVMRVVDDVRHGLGGVRANKRKGLLRRCRQLLKVVADDLTRDSTGDLCVDRRVQRDRAVSVTDPQARHGRKSKSKVFQGFKLHVLGDVVSGFIASLAVTPGNGHDGTPAPRLVGRAKALLENLNQILGDTAYGGAQLRQETQSQQGVHIVAPPPLGQSGRSEKLSKNAFMIDFRNNTATCPNGQVSSDVKSVVRKKADGPPPQLRFTWSSSQCVGCPHASRCPTSSAGGRGRHSILLHPHEEALRAARKEWEDPKIREAYRTRSQCERLVFSLTRRGGRRARQWGASSARQQAYAIAASSNLSLLAQTLAATSRSEVRRAA